MFHCLPRAASNSCLKQCHVHGARSALPQTAPHSRTAPAAGGRRVPDPQRCVDTAVHRRSFHCLLLNLSFDCPFVDLSLPFVDRSLPLDDLSLPFSRGDTATNCRRLRTAARAHLQMEPLPTRCALPFLTLSCRAPLASTALCPPPSLPPQPSFVASPRGEFPTHVSWWPRERVKTLAPTLSGVLNLVCLMPHFVRHF